MSALANQQPIEKNPPKPVESALRRAILEIEDHNGNRSEQAGAWLKLVHDLVNAKSSYFFRIENQTNTPQLTNRINAPSADIENVTLQTIRACSEGFSDALYQFKDGEYGDTIHCIALNNLTLDQTNKITEFAAFVTAEGTPFVKALIQERLELAASISRLSFDKNDHDAINRQSAFDFTSICAQPTLASCLKSAAKKMATTLNSDFTAIVSVKGGVISKIGVHGTEKPSATYVAEIKTIASEALGENQTTIYNQTTKNSLAVEKFLGHGGKCLLVSPSLDQPHLNGCIVIAESVEAATANSFSRSLADIVIAKQSGSLVSRIIKLSDHIFPTSIFPPKNRAAILGGGLLLLAFLPVPNALKAPAQLYSQDRQTITAPISARLDQVSVDPGMKVVEGETVIAKFDTRNLESERDALAAKKSAHLAQYSLARAEGDPAQARIAFLNAEQAEAELALIELKIERSTIIAPVSGIVIGANLRDQLGETKTHGDILVEIAGTDRLEAVVRASAIDARKLDQIKNIGKIKLRAYPGKNIPIEIQHLYPTAESDNGVNSIRLVASLPDDLPRNTPLMPGLEGEATFHAGWRPLSWHLLQKPIQQFRILTGL